MAFQLHFARSALGVRCVPRIAFISQHHGWHVHVCDFACDSLAFSRCNVRAPRFRASLG